MAKCASMQNITKGSNDLCFWQTFHMYDYTLCFRFLHNSSLDVFLPVINLCWGLVIIVVCSFRSIILANQVQAFIEKSLLNFPRNFSFLMSFGFNAFIDPSHLAMQSDTKMQTLEAARCLYSICFIRFSISLRQSQMKYHFTMQACHHN